MGIFIVGAVISIATLLIYVAPVRQRIPVVNMMFSGFDRPEDRPMTLLWLSTQVIAGYLVIIPFLVLYVYHDMEHLILLPLLIAAIGDGLAEPVGVRFGRHSYQVRALFSDKKYYRTLEGSACVFLVSVAVIFLYHASFSLPQFIAAMLVMPAIMTLTEAFSPHTWDTPTLFLVGYLALFGIMFI
jgi:phytol kinase